MRSEHLFARELGGNWAITGVWWHCSVDDRMAQTGILSFFSKASKPAGKTKQEEKSKDGGTIVASGPESMSDDLKPELDSSESPVKKRKSRKRHAIVDSESESDGEGVTVEGGSVGGVEEREEGKRENSEMEEPSNEVVAEDPSEGEVVKYEGQNGTAEATRPVASPLKAAPQLTAVDVLRTPPKRATARKHTGPIRRATPTRRSPANRRKKSPPPKRAKLESLNGAGNRDDNRPTTVEEGTADGIDPAIGEKNPPDDDGACKDEAKEGENETETEIERHVSGDGAEGQLGGSEVEGEAMDTAESAESGCSKEVPKSLPSSLEADGSEGQRGDDSGTAKKTPVHPFFAARTPKKRSGKAAVKQSPAPKVEEGSSLSVSPADGKGNGASGKTAGSEGEYNPAQAGYRPVEDACWQRGQKVPYLAVAKTFEKIEEESKRLKIVAILTNFFRSVIALTPAELVQCVYLCINKLAPAYEGLELGIGESLLMKAIAGTTGRSVQQIKRDVAEKGDLGIVAESSRSTQRMMFTPPKLTVPGVFAKLKDIATMSGSTSMSKKVDIIKGMFVACRQSEARYLIRSLGGKLRIGLAEQSVLMAIAHAAVYTPPGQEWPLAVTDASKEVSAEKFHKQLEEAALTVKTSYCEHPNYDVLVPSLLSHGLAALPAHCRLTPGIPLKPMLAHPTKGVAEVLRRFENAAFTCEWKYDGERAQIHVLDNGEIKIYSRNSENNTSKYPDIIARMPKVLKESVKSCVIDAEAVAWDTEKQQILPFQVLSHRKRKDADITNIEIQVCIFAFDLLYLNDKSLVREPLRTRRGLLRSSFNEIEGEFMFATAMDSLEVEQIQEFMEESIKGNCEGLMVKTLEKDATYEIARRSHNWLKLKKDYLEGVGDTLDLVVVGGFHGSGKRTGKYGGFLLACYDEENEEFQVICKLGTGLKDDELEQHTQFLQGHVIEEPKPYYRHSKGVQPDQWFDTVQVWEVKAADLSISPVYTAAAGIVDPEKGISLRFPRFLRIREDKKPEEATTSAQVAEMYRSQQNNAKASGSGADPEDFY